jgi:hypothetical protein
MKTWERGTYIGDRLDTHGRPLKGKKALLLTADSGVVKAQFDDTTTGFGFGWHEFNPDDWERDTLEQNDET